MKRLIGRAMTGYVLPFCALLALADPASAGMPLVSRITVTDVTPRSFAVAWESSEPATGSLLLFTADCATQIPGPLLNAEQSDRTGIIRVTVSELAADTSYCFRTETTSKGSGEVSLQPSVPLPITTARLVVREKAAGSAGEPFANDILRMPPPYAPTSPGDPDGVLALLSLPESAVISPLSLLLTADETRHYFNVNNLFGAANGSTLNLTGGERVRITERHGLLGCTLDRFRLVPADGEVTRATDFARPGNPLDIDCSGSVTVLDLLRVARGNGAAQGAPCFNSDLDLNADGKVDLLDVEAAIGGFDESF